MDSDRFQEIKDFYRHTTGKTTDFGVQLTGDPIIDALGACIEEIEDLKGVISFLKDQKQVEDNLKNKQIVSYTEYRCGTEYTYNDGTSDFLWSSND